MTESAKGLVQPVYEYMQGMILGKQLMPGDRIPEMRIALELGVSRTPVRDAMRQLANEGLVDVHPNRLARVAEYGEEAIHDIGVLRIALDSMSVRLASLYGSQADFLRLRQIAVNCYEAMLSGDQPLRRRYDSDFHMELASISGNALLKKFQKELYVRVQFIILHYPNPVEGEKRSLNQHFAVVEALMARDDMAALKIIVDHLVCFYNLGDKYPDDFFSGLPADALLGMSRAVAERGAGA